MRSKQTTGCDNDYIHISLKGTISTREPAKHSFIFIFRELHGYRLDIDICQSNESNFKDF